MQRAISAISLHLRWKISHVASDDHSARADYALEIIDYANFVTFSDASSLKFQLSCNSYKISQIKCRGKLFTQVNIHTACGEIPRNYLAAA